MNVDLFNDMMAGFAEAKKRRVGRKAKLRVSRFVFDPVQMKPTQIRRIRTRLQLCQPEFADFLCTSVGAIQSWEQGVRTPHKSALRLLAIAKAQPALLLQRHT
jgi:DNA-binding transcriptional regulator YiaG